jgi:hypothetical protein
MNESKKNIEIKLIIIHQPQEIKILIVTFFTSVKAYIISYGFSCTFEQF